MYKFPENFYSDVRIERIYHSAIRLELGQLEEIKESTDSGAFIRLYDGKRWYYSSTTDLNSINDELAGLAKLAKENPNVNETPIVKKIQKNVGNKCIFTDCLVEKIDLKTKKELLESYDAILAADKEITHRSSVYSDTTITKHFYSSIGSDVTFDFQLTGVRSVFTFGTGANAFTEMWCKADTKYENSQICTKNVKQE